jgi:hypothetical protein
VQIRERPDQWAMFRRFWPTTAANPVATSEPSETQEVGEYAGNVGSSPGE